MERAHHCANLDALLDFARMRNMENVPPLLDEEVMQVAGNVWGYTERGQNFVGSNIRMVRLHHGAVEELAPNHPHAFRALLAWLERWNGGRDQFFLAKGTAEALGWTLRTFKSARQIPVGGWIICVHRGGNGANDPPIYAWK
jgi:hypothetical protein